MATTPTQTFSLTIPKIPNVNNSLQLIATNDANDSWGFRAYAGFKEYPLKVEGKSFLLNPSFETASFSPGWQHETHTWLSPTPGSFQPPKSTIVSGGPDPIDPSLLTANVGRFAARVNDSDPNYHISSVQQSAIVPNVERPEVRLYWAAVLEDPQHQPNEQPYVDVVVRDDTAGQTLHSRHFYSNDPSFSGWRSVQNGTWKSIPWQIIAITLPKTAVGHTVTVRVVAADCALGGHGGYAYLDGDIN